MRTLAVAVAAAVVLAGCGQSGDERELPYHRWHEPAGGDAAGGVVLALHGGTWMLTGEEGAETMRPVVERLTRQGHTVLNGSYAPGADGLPDVEALYDMAQDRAGGDGVCVYGQSAGGFWALELAIRRHDVACVVAEAPPTDLEALARISGEARTFLSDKFGGDLRARSPIRGPFGRSTRILIGGARHDTIVPWSQARRFRAAWPRTELVSLRPGRILWVHARVHPRSLRSYELAAARFLNSALLPD